VGSNIESLPGETAGQPVSLSSDGRRLAIGYPRDDNATDYGPGRVAVYERSGDSWSRLGADIYGEANDDYAGGAVALSGNGLRVAIGARDHDDAVAGSDAGQARIFEWLAALGDAIPGPATYFSFVLPDGRECTSISPQRVQVGTMVELPGENALCQTMEGSSVAGWVIPTAPGFTGYGSAFEPFPPGLKVRVIESQRFTLVPLEPVMKIALDANVADDIECVVNQEVTHRVSGDRLSHTWVPREIYALARAPLQAPCQPQGYELTGWNTTGDGTGVGLAPGAPLPAEWQNHMSNHHTLYAVWVATD
jgi:hypothetical protein